MEILEGWLHLLPPIEFVGKQGLVMIVGIAFIIIFKLLINPPKK